MKHGYHESARVYDALLRHKDYAGASKRLRQLVRWIAPHATSLLDVGCGTGRYLELLKDFYEVEGLDLSAEMLAVARERCPSIVLHEADLVDFRLGRKYDVVCCLFGSVGYGKTVKNLQRSIACMAHHLNPNGMLVVEPWITPERFVPGKVIFDRVDEPDLKVARIYLTQRKGRVSVYQSDYVVGTPQGVVHFTERQEIGLFTDKQYRAAFQNAGIELVRTDTALFGYGLYAGKIKTGRR